MKMLLWFFSKIILPSIFGLLFGFIGILIANLLYPVVGRWLSLGIAVFFAIGLMVLTNELKVLFTRPVEPPPVFIQAFGQIARLELEVQMTSSHRQVVTQTLWKGFFISIGKFGNVYVRQLKVSEEWISYADRLASWLLRHCKTRFEVIRLEDVEVELLAELAELEEE